MNAFDTEILNFLNQFSQSSWSIDLIANFIVGNNLIKGGVLLIIFWWGWSRVDRKQQHIQVLLISTLFSCFIAIIVARAASFLLPFRLRPLHEDSLGLKLPYGSEPAVMEQWSAFPSDHAVLFYALATGIFYISSKAGILAIIYTTFIIALPRVYLGLHYPTDIFAGAFVGIAIALLCQSNYFIKMISQPVLNFSQKKPEFFYPALFIITFQIADMFNDSRSIVEFIGVLF